MLDKILSAAELGKQILDLQMMLSVASETPVGEASPIDWDATALELAEARAQLEEIIPGRVDKFLTSLEA